MSPITTAQPIDALGFFGRLKAFADNIFAPKLHTAFAAFWSLSLLGSLHVVSGAHVWRWDASLAVLVATVFTCLFFLRMVDEIKDYDYDVVHNPDRPLVSGLVTRGDIARYLVVFAAIVLPLNAVLAPTLAIWVAIDMAYGLLQLPLERWSKAVRENLFVNLIAVYPVNIGLSVYTVLFFLQHAGHGAAHAAHAGGAFEAKHALLVVAYACAFLHFEIARKSGWPRLTPASERLYSSYVGLGGALSLSTAFGLAAIGLVVWLLAPWTRTGPAAITGCLPILALVPLAIGLARFAKNRAVRHAARPPAVAFLFAFYVTLLVHAVTACRIVGGTP